MAGYACQRYAHEGLNKVGSRCSRPGLGLPVTRIDSESEPPCRTVPVTVARGSRWDGGRIVTVVGRRIVRHCRHSSAGDGGWAESTKTPLVVSLLWQALACY